MCLLNNLSDVLFIDAKLLFSSVRLFKSSSVNMKRLTLLGEKQEQGLVGLATSAHVRNSMQYFFPFLPPKWSLGTSQFSLCFWDEQPVPGKHTFDFTYPAALRLQVSGCSCTRTSAASEGLPWARALWASTFFLHFTPIGLSLSGWLLAS